MTHGMTKEEMIAYFNRCAPTWDAETIRSDDKIRTILDYGGITEGVRVLDVACGTGVLFPDYLQRKVARLVGVDIAPKMAKIAAEKFPDPRVRVICADIQTLQLPEAFDCVMIYDAFPHFPEPEPLIAHLASCLAANGRLTIAHSMSRAQIDAFHGEVGAEEVSVGLIHEDTLAQMLAPYFHVDVVLSDDEKYVVSGTKRL
ncbi:MAG: class I SAM-dependent methyltransferase [Oscillospiraceae bacterium]|jgi:ubiquinone/menaquinone biosynthesis C-methylase UbiE